MFAMTWRRFDLSQKILVEVEITDQSMFTVDHKIKDEVIFCVTQRKYSGVVIKLHYALVWLWITLSFSCEVH